MRKIKKPVAKFVRKIEGWNGDARLYRCEKGNLPEYVIVSAVIALFTGPETYIFPADKDGKAKDMLELDGSFRGALDHKAALVEAGYEVR